MKKPKLSTFSFGIPLMFEVRTAKRLSLACGLYGGITFGGRTKINLKKVKDNGDFGVNFFNTALSARIQYCKTGVFAEYSQAPLFKDGAGPETHPFTTGLIFL